MTAPGEWIDWAGGGCPVAATAQVKTMLRCEREDPSSYVDAVLPASDCEWRHNKHDPKLDLVAYRIVS